MQTSRLQKWGVGLATAFEVFAPLVLLPMFFWYMFQIFSQLENLPPGTQPDPAFMGDFFSMWLVLFPIICVLSTVHLGLMIFYLIHIIRNPHASDMMRILMGVGIFLLPQIGMPVYFFLYIWSERPPEWGASSSPEAF